MRIAQICYLYEPAIGGVELVVKKISEGLVALGHEVHVFASDFTSLACNDRVPLKYEVINGVHVHRISAWKLPKKHLFAARMMFPALFRQLWKFGPFDVMHVHSIPSNHYDVAWLYGRIRGVPLVVHGHYSPDDLETVYRSGSLGGRYFRWWVKSLLRRASRYVAVVGVEKEKVGELCRVDSRKIEVIPNGVSPEEFDKVSSEDVARFRERHGLAQKRLVIFVGRVTHHKGADLLIAAMNRLFAAGRMPDCQVLVIGPQVDASYQAQLHQQAGEQGFGARFHFLELCRADVVAAMKACEVLVLPSRGEVFGIVLAEAMYCGKLVIGTNAGGIPEVLDGGRCGLLFEKNDVNGLVSRISQAMEEPVDAGMPGIAAAGHERASRNLNWTTISAQVEALYRQLQCPAG